MFKKYKKLTFERITSIILIVSLALVVVLSIPSLGYLIMEEVLTPPIWVITVEKIRSILDLVLWILIAIELIETVRIYLDERGLKLETVLTVSMIAMARKIIAVRLRDYEPVMVLGMAALIASLGLSYYLIRKSRSFHDEYHQDERMIDHRQPPDKSDE